jgi:hypothetical protein
MWRRPSLAIQTATHTAYKRLLLRIQQGNLRLTTARAQGGLGQAWHLTFSSFDRPRRSRNPKVSFAVIIILCGHRLSKKMVCAIPAYIIKCSNLSVDLWGTHQPAHSKLNMGRTYVVQTTNAKPALRTGSLLRAGDLSFWSCVMQGVTFLHSPSSAFSEFSELPQSPLPPQPQRNANTSCPANQRASQASVRRKTPATAEKERFPCE